VLVRVQRRALRMVSNLRGRTYEARLEEVGMTSLEDRRVRGDMIPTYRIMTGKDKVDHGQFLTWWLMVQGREPGG
jgi:ribonuclease P/MRP protein subunit RPP40